MKNIYFSGALACMCFVACSPASETQAHMTAVAKRTSDSITHWLDSALNDPLREMSATSAIGYTPVIQPK